MTLQADKLRIESLISVLRESTRLLAALARMTEEEFSRDVHKVSSAKYNFIVAIEAAIDIANHIISRNRMRAPEDYADTFQVLAEAGIIELDFALELAKMARFRNRLVHVYWKIDDKQVYHILCTKLEDIERFIQRIAAQSAQ